MTAPHDEIQIADVIQELAKLGAEGQKKGQIKGCLFSLIVYSQDPARSIFLNEIVQTITETFPCRIIFIECTPQADHNLLKVSVESNALKKSSPTIFYDRINIKCSNGYLKRIPFLVLPYFVPDLPIYLLWGQDPSQENEILPKLQAFATRLIFDSDSSCDLRAFCRKMLSDVAHSRIPVTDMNWASLTSWRDILFQVFDTEDKIKELKHSKELIIRFNNKVTQIYQHTERRSVYLQGWLASQLDWKYKNSRVEKGSLKITYDNGVNETEVRLIGEEKNELTPGAIFDVLINTQVDRSYDLIRMSAEPFIKTHITAKDACELPATLPLRHSKKGLIFMNEIFFAKCSGHYWKMLKAIEPLQVPC